MRTTVNLSETALATARRYAAARSINLGEAVSQLIEAANDKELAMKEVNGIWIADLPADKKTVTVELVDTLLHDE
ncbi:MAG: hypothetical protein ACRCWJ_13625 [Casimicrobium sp.]